MESKYVEWWGSVVDKILHIAVAEKENDRVQAILELAGEITDGTYIAS